MAERKKYNYMEEVIKHIVKTKISLPEDTSKINNAILRSVVDQIIRKLQAQSPLFKKLYLRIFYGGSYYDNLKVGKPDEYDLDLLLVIDDIYTCILKPITDVPGFVTLEIVSPTKEINDLLSNQYLSTEKVLRWMESIMTKALKEFEPSGNQYIINTEQGIFYVKTAKSGPAFRLEINSDINKINSFNVDLVPCFKFGAAHWPKGDFKENVTTKSDFFIVAKKSMDPKFQNISWRLSFQDQEKEILKNSLNLKPVMKLLKQLRDKLSQKEISSYFIKTIFLWEVQSQPNDFWKNSLSYIFMQMLDVYSKYLYKGEILYYWNKNNNLLNNISIVTLQNYANRIKNIISDINKKEDPLFIAKYYLNYEEIENIPPECKLKDVSYEIQNTSRDRSVHENINVNSINECECGGVKNIEIVVQLLKELLTKVDNLETRFDNLEVLVKGIRK